jgi:hypothetical protein
MKLTLVNKRDGKSSTFVIKGWLRGLLSLCLLGAPVAFGCFGYQVAWSDSPAAQIAGRVSGIQEGSQGNNSLADLAEIAIYQTVEETDTELRYGVLPRSHVLPLALVDTLGSGQTAINAPYGPYKFGRIVDPATYFSITLI